MQTSLEYRRNPGSRQRPSVMSLDLKWAAHAVATAKSNPHARRYKVHRVSQQINPGDSIKAEDPHLPGRVRHAVAWGRV